MIRYAQAMERDGRTKDGERDLAFVKLVLAGDAAAREEFAARMACVVRFLAALNEKHGHPLQQADLDDAAGSVREKVWEKLHTFAGRSRLETWVGGFCENEFSSARRRRRDDRGSGLIDPPDPRDASGALELLDSNLERLLKHLSDQEERVVRLHVERDMESKEIARELGITESSVKEYWSRALKKLEPILLENRHAAV
jgi:RNA polymerase sigma factor (sigma-70 family)